MTQLSILHDRKKTPSHYYIYTLGCQMNYSDTERVESVVENLGYRKSALVSDADLVIFNTCSIRQKAEDRVYGQMKNLAGLKKRNKNLRIGITGCMVRKSSTRLSPELDKLLKQIDDLDFVFRIEELAALPQLISDVHPHITINPVQSDELENYFKINPIYTSKFQAFVPIMKGCDKFCTYCIVPYSRGREIGRRVEEVVSEVQKLVDGGCLEVTLLGQNVNSYGKSMLDKRRGAFAHIEGSPFAWLLRELDKIPKLQRVRFTSPHPQDMCDQVIQACKTLRVMCPYVHLPVQAGDNQVLKRMNRTYTREHYTGIIKKLRHNCPDMSISTDIIVGYSGETEEQFENTWQMFKELEFDHAYLAQYSPRPGTYGARNFKDDVPAEEKQRRWHRLNDLLRKISHKKHRAYEGRTVEVLVEKCEDGICEGRSESFKRTLFPGGPELIGTFQQVKITEGLEWMLKGEIFSFT